MRPATVAICLAAVILACFAGGCASTDEKPKHATYRKWYQGDMNNEERSFFLDTFFKGQ